MNADFDQIVDAIVHRAIASDGGFLYARLVTSLLRDQPVNTTVQGWEAALDVSVASAFDRELAAGPQRRRDSRIPPEAARHLLAALAASFGRGLPARDLWPALATALAGGGDVRYDDKDIAWVLERYGRYVVESGEHGQAVYRLFHQELVNHLAPAGEARDRLDLAIGDLWAAASASGQKPEDANPYLRAYGHAHLARAGEPGLAVLRRLAEANPTAYLPDLAGSLNNLTTFLTGEGRWQEAVTAAEEAVRLSHRLVNANPPSHLPSLVTSLNNLATCQSVVGRRQEAVASAEEAARLSRELAEANPASHLPNLALSLNTLANCLSAVGRRQDALAPADEAVRLRRRLADANPTAYLPNLAGSLNTLALRLSEGGRWQEALTPADEAVRLLRQLADTAPAAHLPDLATALNTLANCLSDVGLRQEALAPAEEAVHIRRQLAQEIPAAHLTHLATALNNLANRLSEVGRRQDALAPAEEAVHLFRQQVEAAPAASTHDLAMSLNNLALHLAGVGRHQDALAPAEEAVHIYRQLVDAAPAAYLPNLAMALHNLAVLLPEMGRRQEALAPAEEAVHIYRQLVDAAPAAHRPNLAMALNNLAVRLSKVGRRQEALAPAEEAVHIRRRLAEANPAAHLPNLAASLNTLANCLSAVGRRAEAEDRYDEVVQAFADPSARAFLLLRRVSGQPQRPVETRVDDALAALDLASVTTPPAGPLLADSHATVRGLRRASIEEFDQAWHQRRAGLPAWLTLGDDTFQAVADWVNTPTWAASRDHLAARPELLGPSTDLVLAEFALVDLDDLVLARHQQLLDRVRADGVAAAYAPLLADELVANWIATPAWDDSRTFLDAHLDQLVSPAGQAALAARLADTPGNPVLVVHLALLTLAALGQAEAGYQTLTSDAAGRRQVLDAALDTADPQPLAACAQLAFIAAGDDQDRADALLPMAVAHALTEQPDTAVEAARAARAFLDDAAVLAWVNRLVILMGRLGARAGLLAPLTAALTAPAVPAAGNPEAGEPPHAVEPAVGGTQPPHDRLPRRGPPPRSSAAGAPHDARFGGRSVTRQPFDDVLVVIPGIMGSTLLRDGVPVWDLSARVVATNLFTLGRAARRLTLPAGIGDEHPGDGVVPGRLMPDLHVLPGLWSVTVGYDRLLDRLTSRFDLTPVDPLHPDRPANLVPFAYDWRLSNRFNGRRLGQVVEPVLDRWRAQPGRAEARLVFVCHSMGGLVARWYLDREGGAAHTRKLVTLATPHRGALRALTTLVNGIRFGVGPLAVDLTALAASLPSLHQLLPEYACIDTAAGTGLAKTTETAVPTVDPTMLADAMRFHDELDRAPAFLPAASGDRGPTVDLHPIVGIHQPTTTTVRFRDGTAVPEVTIGGVDERGDATVPRLAARPRTLPGDSPTLVHIGDTHGALQANTAVLDHLEGILTGNRAEHREAAVNIGVTAADIIPAGQPLHVHAYPGDPRVLLEARLFDPHDPSGRPVARRHLTRDGEEHHTALTDIPPGGYELHVGRRLPSGHLIDTVTTPIAVIDDTSADPD